MKETWEVWVWSLGWEDPLQDMATHSSILAWRIPWTEEPGGLQSMGLQRVWHDWETNTSSFHFHYHLHVLGFPGILPVKNPPAEVEDMGSIPELGRSPGEGNGNLLQSSCLRNPMDKGAWWAAVHVVAKSQTQLSDQTTTTTACVTFSWRIDL